jgi:AcrR family transcriptional regulator
MARPTKAEAGKDTREELIEAARRLFSTVGYDATPVEAILEEVGLSKGTFYYYFSSKEDILDAVVSRMIDEMALVVEPIPSLSSLSPVEKLGRFIEALSNWKLANIAILREAVEVIYRDENAIIRHKVNRKAVKNLSPVLAEIIGQGLEEGIFDVEYPEDTAEMLMHFSNAVSEMQWKPFTRLGEDPSARESILRGMKLYLGAIERILGVPGGSLFPIGRDLVEGYERALEVRRSGENAR